MKASSGYRCFMENRRECPFSDYEGHIRFLKGNMRRRHDNFLVVHGPEGAGKTTVADNIALDLKPDFDLRRDVIRSMEDLLRLVIRRADMPPEESSAEVVVVDEGADIFHNRDWNTVENKEYTKLGRKTRILAGTWIVNIPDFEGLDPWIREHRCWQRIYQPIDFDSDGFVHTEAKVLWRNEWFDYTEQRVVHRWQDVYDLDVPSLDGHPQWKGYESDKRRDIKEHATRFMARINQPAHLRRLGKAVAEKPAKGKARVAKANGSTVAPPTTT